MARKKKQLEILRNDPWLEPFEAAIEGRHEDVIRKLNDITSGTGGSLVDFANAYKYFGLHREKDGSWIFREYAPNATGICLIGTFNDWTPNDDYRLTRIDGGTWEIHLAKDMLHDGDLFKMLVSWEGAKEKEFLHMPPEWCRMTTQRYSRHRSTHLRNHINSK